jgi:hypothetical protein
MALIYFAAGIFILTNSEKYNIVSNYTVPFGILMLVYGAFRGYSVYRKFKEDQ